MPPAAYVGYGQPPFFALPSGGFVVFSIADSGDVQAFESADGISWDDLPDLPAVGAMVSDVTRSSDGVIVAVGTVQSRSGKSAMDSAVAWTISRSGAWQSAPLSPADGSLVSSVVAGPAGFLASGSGPSGIELWASADGIGWHSVVTSGIPSDVDQPRLFANGTGYVLAQLFQPRVWYSTDGIRWTETYRAPALSGLSSYYMGSILKAPDGSYRSFGGIYTGTGIAVPGPTDRLIWTSRDLTHWTMSAGFKDPGWIDGYVSAPGGYVAAGTQPGAGGFGAPGPLGVWKSVDGRHWNPVVGLSSLPESQVVAVLGDGQHVVIAFVDAENNLQLLVGNGLI